MSSVDFLFVPGVQKILAQVYADPGRDFTLNELLQSAAGGRGNNQRQVERLLGVGVLAEGPRRARQRCIKANTAHFLYDELRSIARKSFGLREPLRVALAPFAHQIERAFVFGSVAKGTDTGASDVDLIVIGTAPLMALSEAVLSLEQTLCRPVRLSMYGAQEWQALVANDPVVAQIANGPQLNILPHDAPH